MLLFSFFSFLFFFFYRRIKVSLRSVPAGACEIADSVFAAIVGNARSWRRRRGKDTEIQATPPNDESVRFSVAVEPFLPESKKKKRTSRYLLLYFFKETFFVKNIFNLPRTRMILSFWQCLKGQTVTRGCFERVSFVALSSE